MKCGHCKGDHETIAQVKLCSVRTGVQVKEIERELEPTGTLWGNGLRPVKPSEQRREVSRQDLFADINKLGREIPAGHYALPNGKGAANDVAFYQLDKPTLGRYKGKAFLKQIVGPSVERVPAARQLVVLTQIAANVQEASARYGQLVGQCGVCGRRLTNEESRSYGIGPECRRKNGW